MKSFKLAALALLCLSPGLGAQAPQAPAPQAPSSPAPQAPGAKPTFRVAVDFVTTDVIARNDRDQFVADLTKNDFEVYEDGVKQEITSMTLVHGGRVHNLMSPPVQTAAQQDGLILPVSRPRNEIGRAHV